MNALKQVSSFRFVCSMVALAVSATVIPGWLGRAARADGPGPGAYVVRVEEDWSLLVDQPDNTKSSPQVSTQMTRAPYTTRFCNFHVNSCDVPTFRQGGLQLQAWNGAVNQTALSIASAMMNTNNELVTWTQYIRNDGGTLKFGIGASSSTTWDDFSGQEILFPSSSTYLDDYSADYSVANSGVTYGANRVSSMVLVAVRKYYSDGTMTTDATPRSVYTNPGSSGSGGN